MKPPSRTPWTPRRNHPGPAARQVCPAAQDSGRDYTVDWVHLKLNDRSHQTILCKDPFRSMRRTRGRTHSIHGLIPNCPHHSGQGRDSRATALPLPRAAPSTARCVHPALDESVSVRRLLALLLPVLLLLTACGGNRHRPRHPAPRHPAVERRGLGIRQGGDLAQGQGPQGHLRHAAGDQGESMRLVTPGDGAQIKDGQIVAFQQAMLTPLTARPLVSLHEGPQQDHAG